MRNAFCLILLLALMPACATAQSASAVTPEQAEFFEKKIRPVLAENCFSCHGPKKQQGGLRLDGRAAFRKGGDSGPVVVPGKPGESLLIKAVRQDGELKMPPKRKLSAGHVEALAEW